MAARIIWRAPRGGPPPGGARWGGGGRLRLCRRIDPAGMDPAAQAVRHLGIDGTEEAHQAAKRRLDMAARTAEPVIKVEMAKRRIEVVAPHQNHHPATEPDAFGIAGRTVDGLLRLDEFIGFALIVLGRI